MKRHKDSIPPPQVKVCGLTRVEEACACVRAGAHAIGLVFYPDSPRHVTEEEARAICKALPQCVTAVGVFVNESFSAIMHKVGHCGLKAVQLHGQEPPELVEQIRAEGVGVIKSLFVNASPSLRYAIEYPATAFLVESGGGPQPGGNALVWHWDVPEFSRRFPLILAGGLEPENVSAAIESARPDAVDVSSGVERKPGRKDPRKVERFMNAVAQSVVPRKPRRVF